MAAALGALHNLACCLKLNFSELDQLYAKYVLFVCYKLVYVDLTGMVWRSPARSTCHRPEALESLEL